MLVCKDIATGIAGVDDDHSNSVLICKSFDSLQINLPNLFGQKIEQTEFQMVSCSKSFIERITRSWEKNVGTRAGKDLYYEFNCLSTSNCEINIIWG